MDLGDTLRFSSDVHDEAGALTTPLTALLTVTLPDGTTATPTVSTPATGQYYADYVTTTLPGRYVGQWLFTFSGGKTTSYRESFDVGAGLVTVNEALAHLRAADVISSEPDLEELQRLCLVATDQVESILGIATTPRTVVEIHDGGGAIILRRGPVISITSITEFGTSLVSTDYTANLSAGILYRGSSSYQRGFTRGYQNVVVTYIAGYFDPPEAIRQAAKDAVLEMWQETQQAPHPFLESEPVMSPMGAPNWRVRPEFLAYKAAAIA